MVPAGGDEAWVCLVVTVQHAVPEGGDEAWACLVVSVQHAVPEVPEGGGRAWPGFEPTRRAEGSRRGRRAGGPPPSGTESSRGGGLLPSGTDNSWEGRCGYRSSARPFLTARSRW